MDFGRAFSYVFEDERWLAKVGIGGLITLVPILNFAVWGYMIKVAQNVAQNNPRPLPEWNDLGDHFMRGFYAIVTLVVYFIPYIVVVALFSCVLGGIGSASGDSDAAAGALGLFSCLIVPLYLLVGLACSVLGYAGLARFVATNSLSEALKFGEVVASVRAKPGPWLMFLLLVILASFVGGLGFIACGIGVFFTTFYAYLVMGHGLGQTAAQQGLMSAVPPVPPVSYDPPSTTSF